MAGFMDILGTIVQQGLSNSSGTRLSHAFGVDKSGGSLTNILGELSQMINNVSTGQSSQAAGSGLGGVLGEVMGSLAGNKTALGGLGALAGAILGGGKSSARGAIGGGGLAMLASLAYAALKKAGQASNTPPRALFEPQTPQEEKALEQDAEIIIKAMINAAKADGQIDQNELQKIVGKLEENGLTQQEKEFFLTEAQKPLDLQSLAASAQGDPELAVQIYAASLLAIEVDTPAEQQYIEQLAKELQLDPQVPDHIRQALGIA